VSAGILAGRVIKKWGAINRAAAFEARHWRAFILYTTGGDAGAPMAPMPGTFISRARFFLSPGFFFIVKYFFGVMRL